MLLLLGEIALHWLYFPMPLALKTTEADAEIFFAVDRSQVFWPSDCVEVHWAVENIQAVYVNRQGQIGSGTLPYCLDSLNAPSLTVELTNGETFHYEIPVPLLSRSPLFWLFVAFTGIVIAYYIMAYLSNDQAHYREFAQAITFHPFKLLMLFLLLSYTFAYILISIVVSQLSRLRFVVMIVLWVMVFALGKQFIPPTQETIATGNWREAATAIQTLLTGLGVFTLALLITAQLALKEDRLRYSTKMLYGWGIGAGLALALMVGLILYVNPRGMYLSQAYTPHQLLLRGAKFEAYQALETPPELVLLGSSRMFTLSPRYIEEPLGYSAFNMAVEGGRTEDILIASRFLQDQPNPPSVFLVEVQEGLPREPNDIASRAPLNWLPYMQSDTQWLTAQKRFEALFDITHFSEALYIARYNPLYSRTQQEWAVFLPDGQAERPLISPGELAGNIAINIGTIPPLQCDGVNPISQAEITEWAEATQSRNQALVFYISPWHPDYYNALMRDNPEYQRCHQQSVAFMTALTETYPHVFFEDYSQLERINGLSDENGYYDSDHLTPENSRRLVDHLAETLNAAFDFVRQIP
jgi:hypothetical protein